MEDNYSNNNFGDSVDDLDGYEQYDEQFLQNLVDQLPSGVGEFIGYFSMTIYSTEENKLDQIQQNYDTNFTILTDRHYKNTRWPEASVIAPLCQNDGVFIILYKELYYRHIYANLKPTLQERFESYANYCDLFSYILNQSPTDLELPHVWLWDIIDEFIYQYQSFHHFIKRNNMDENDAALLKKNTGKWNVQILFNVLHSLVEKSNINPQLVAFKLGGDITHADAVAGEYGELALYKMLGYFSLIGLCRLNCLHGDYSQALKLLENVELSRNSGVLGCQITTCYYVGFAYMMLQRYQDACRTFSTSLQFLHRSKQFNKNYQYDSIAKKTDQMYQLLGITITLHSQRIDEHLHQNLKETLGDRLNKMQKHDKDAFMDLFKYACPKFVNPVPSVEADVPDFTLSPTPITTTESSTSTASKKGKSQHAAMPAFKKQLDIFMYQVSQRLLISTIRSYLRLYTTMSIGKLANFMEKTEDETRTILQMYKHKSVGLVWKDGPPFSGVEVSNSDLDYYVEGDMIHVAATKVERRYGQYFIRQIGKFKNINDIVDNLPSLVK